MTGSLVVPFSCVPAAAASLSGNPQNDRLKDFLSKVYIALKECAETAYWLELLYSTDYLSEPEFRSLLADCEELRRMLSATTKSTR